MILIVCSRHHLVWYLDLQSKFVFFRVHLILYKENQNFYLTLVGCSVKFGQVMWIYYFIIGLRYDHLPDPACGQALTGEVGEQHHQDLSRWVQLFNSLVFILIVVINTVFSFRSYCVVNNMTWSFSRLILDTLKQSKLHVISRNATFLF